MILESGIGACMVLPSDYACMHACMGARMHIHREHHQSPIMTTSQLSDSQQGIMVHWL